jgi:putative methionine-R-sulfoxide reductase with GAF domain
MSATDPIGDGEFFPYTNRPRLADERRHFPRQKPQIPAYSSFNGTSANAQLDLNAILDISEHGIAIQSSPPIEVDRAVNLCLDLAETGATLHVAGHVIWSDRSGRTGISFPELPDTDSRQIREWLFLNLLHASAKHLVDSEAPAAQTPVAPEAAPSESSAERPDPRAQADLPAFVVAVEAVRREVKSLGASLDSALQLVAARARTFTRSTGAAIALSEGKEDEMVCRANAGSDAPPLGARLQVGSGFSGECVRTGLLLRCDDSETDLRVDRESCRALGIRSMAAAPVHLEQRMIGLLEVFSPLPFAFKDEDGQALQGLSEAIVDALKQAGYSIPQPFPDMSANSQQSLPSENWADSLDDDEEDESASRAVADAEAKGGSRSRLGLWIVSIVLLLGALAFWGAPWIGNMIRSKTTGSAESRKPMTQPPPAEVKSMPAKSSIPPNPLEELRTLADKGDPNAQFALGARFATGEQVKQDYSEAVNWFSKAADQGHVVAQATLGAYYWAGRGVPQDLSQAYFWSTLARAGGDEASKYRAAVLSSRMTRSQIAAVQQQADNWLKLHQVASNTTPAH